MLWQCGQMIDGVQEFCDACYECSSRCARCEEWFNKEEVGPQGLCIDCENDQLHRMACYDCGHDWKIVGFALKCPRCASFSILVSGFDVSFYQELIERLQTEYVKKLRAEMKTPPVPETVLDVPYDTAA